MLIPTKKLLHVASSCSRFGARSPSAPRHPDVQLVDTSAGPHAFVVNGSQIYGLAAKAAETLQQGLASSDREAVDRLLIQFGITLSPLIDDRPLASPPLRSLSLAVAQKCNLGCTYCYAQQGAFGGEAKNMALETANRAVDLLLAQAGEGGKANLAFLGGEPLVNRPVIQAVTRRAAALAESRNIALSFSITTNGTLLTEADAA